MEAPESWFSHTFTAVIAFFAGAGGLWLKFRKQSASEWESLIKSSFEQLASLRTENHVLRNLLQTHSNLIATLQLERANCMARLSTLEAKVAELTDRGPGRHVPHTQ